MYTEFIIIFVLLGIVALLLLTVIILQCVTLKKLSNGKKRSSKGETHTPASVYAIGRGTAICRNCATQFAADEKVCPKCGTTR